MGQKHADVAAYGHLTHDTIFEGFEEKTTLGALVNFWAGIVKTGEDINIRLIPSSIGKAVILVDKPSATRVGRGHLNIKTRKIQAAHADWHHVMYLNQLQDLEFLEQIETGAISADITSGTPPADSVLSKLDFLFISDEDLFEPVEQLARKVKGWVIMHHAAGGYCSNGDDSFELKTEKIQNINVLGAGDIFAASFISKKLKTDSSIEECVKYAHKQTTKFLLEEK
mgnify:CR=1 FL=1